MDKALPKPIKSYDDAVKWIYDRINYERIRPQTSSGHFRLDRVARLLELIDVPQKRIPAVHIAGTKGKGSTAAILNSILVESGISTGLFTSPHIELFEERMRVNGAMPTQKELTGLVRDLANRLANADPDIVADGPTYFEVATLLAWQYFDMKNVDIVVLETGLGGRLDCTNVCQPTLTIITSIGLDHTDILGDTIEKIAAEKAGIIKSGVPLLTWVDQPEVIEVIRKKAAEKNCDVSWWDTDFQVRVHQPADGFGQLIDVTTPNAVHEKLRLPLMGRHQAGNAALAVGAADFLSVHEKRITPETIAAGVAATTWPLRFEVFELQPTIVLDAAHNPDSITAFIETCCEQFSDQPKILIFASSRDKDAPAMLKILAPEFDRIVLTQFQHNPRAIEAGELEQILNSVCAESNLKCPTPHVVATPEAALAAARKVTPNNGVICCAGSIFIAAELRTILMGKSVPKFPVGVRNPRII